MRPIGFVLALPFFLPLLGAPSAHADDPAPLAPPGAPAAPKPDTPKPDAPKPSTPPPGAATPAVSKIPFLTDYEAAKAKAAEEKKGLFVYLTPDWFT